MKQIILALLLSFSGQGETKYNNPINIAQDTNLSYDKPYHQYIVEVTYDDILDEAFFNCPNAEYKDIDQQMLMKLIEIEKKYNLPDSLKGMLLAAACHESGFNPSAKGDHKFGKQNRAKAVGLFQMWPWWENEEHGYGINREDPIQAATAYMKHINRQVKTIKKKCKHRNNRKVWLSAWARAIRAPKATGRCGETPKFYRRVLKKWHRNIKRSKIEMEKCVASGDCGC